MSTAIFTKTTLNDLSMLRGNLTQANATRTKEYRGRPVKESVFSEPRAMARLCLTLDVLGTAMAQLYQGRIRAREEDIAAASYAKRAVMREYRSIARLLYSMACSPDQSDWSHRPGLVTTVRATDRVRLCLLSILPFLGRKSVTDADTMESQILRDVLTTVVDNVLSLIDIRTGTPMQLTNPDVQAWIDDTTVTTPDPVSALVKFHLAPSALPRRIVDLLQLCAPVTESLQNPSVPVQRGTIVSHDDIVKVYVGRNTDNVLIAEIVGKV